jgi:hypothetical protein
VADDRVVGSFLAGRSQSKRPHSPGEQAQGILDGSSHAPRLSAGGDPAQGQRAWSRPDNWDV